MAERECDRCGWVTDEPERTFCPACGRAFLDNLRTVGIAAEAIPTRRGKE